MKAVFISILLPLMGVNAAPSVIGRNNIELARLTEAEWIGSLEVGGPNFTFTGTLEVSCLFTEFIVKRVR